MPKNKDFGKNISDKSKYLKNKVLTSFRNKKQYRIFESKQLWGIILVSIFAFLLIVSSLSIPGWTTISSYTFGMLFGWSSYFFYLGFIILGLNWIFQLNIRFDKFIAIKFERKLHFSWISYLCLSTGIALFVQSCIQIYHYGAFPNNSTTAFGEIFKTWWNGFISSGNPLLPNVLNLESCGFVVAFYFSIIASWSGYVVSMIFGLLLASYFFVYLFYGSIINKIKYKLLGKENKKNIVTKEEFEDYKTKIMDLSYEDNLGIVNNQKSELVSDSMLKTIAIDIPNSNDLFPIDNPFNNESNEQQKFIETKTLQLNLDKNNTKEFKLNLANDKIQQSSDIETFDFELDIFKTSTDVVNFDNNISLDTKNVNLSSKNDEKNDQEDIFTNVNTLSNNLYDSKTIVFDNLKTKEFNPLISKKSDEENIEIIQKDFGSKNKEKEIATIIFNNTNEFDEKSNNNEDVLEAIEQEGEILFKNDEDDEEENNN